VRPQLATAVVATVALAHFGLAAAGVRKFDFRRVPVVGATLDYYASLSGAKASYGFFAPEITGQADVEFELKDAVGATRVVPLEIGPTHEMKVRTQDVVERFAGIFLANAGKPEELVSPEEKDLRRSLAATLCGTVMGQHPEAREITFKLKNYGIVSMAQYRAGLRPRWDTVYEAHFRQAE
jgi:hypothetical protein